MTQEELNELREKREKFLTKGLTTRQHRLKDWLKDNFVSGRYYSIEEVVAGVVDSDGNPYYKLNTNPYTHDKCVALGSDVKAINWCITERYIPIIKDKKGGVKLAENKEEVEAYINAEKEKVQRKCEFLNTLASKVAIDGYVVMVNHANRMLSEEEMKPVDVFAK